MYATFSPCATRRSTLPQSYLYPNPIALRRIFELSDTDQVRLATLPLLPDPQLSEYGTCKTVNRGHLQTSERLFPEGQGQNLAVTVLYVPYSLDIGKFACCRDAADSHTLHYCAHPTVVCLLALRCCHAGVRVSGFGLRVYSGLGLRVYPGIRCSAWTMHLHTDNLLSHLELNAFQAGCFGIPLHERILHM